MWFMVVTNVLFTISVWAKCRVRRSTFSRCVRWELAVIGELRRWQIFPLLVVHEQLVWEKTITLSSSSTKRWLTVNLRSIDSYWKNNEINEEDWVNLGHSLIVYSEFQQDLFKLRIDQRDSEMSLSEGFIHIHSPMARVWKKWGH